jgi:hypothetical protein
LNLVLVTVAKRPEADIYRTKKNRLEAGYYIKALNMSHVFPPCPPSNTRKADSQQKQRTGFGH